MRERVREREREREKLRDKGRERESERIKLGRFRQRWLHYGHDMKAVPKVNPRIYRFCLKLLNIIYQIQIFPFLYTSAQMSTYYNERFIQSFGYVIF